ncbi:MAG: sulfite exporter TauE/SafE family protein [Dehalococcoidales bacterium]
MVDAAIITALGFGFLLGLRHALDADHLVTVTTVISRRGSFLEAVKVGLVWGMGHTFTLFAAGIAVLVFKLTIPDRLALSMEMVVGGLMVFLGIPLLRKLLMRRAHFHLHEHGEKTHLHSHSHDETEEHDHRHIRRPLLIGMAHGLAGSGALIPLVMGTMSSVNQGLLFLLLFGVGSMLGMLIFSGLISFPFRLAGRVSGRVSLWMQGIAGATSISFGLYIIWQAVFAEGLLLSSL